MLQHKFVSNEHFKRFVELINLDQTRVSDNERLAFFYVVAGNHDLYRNVDKLYNFEDQCVIAEVSESGIEILVLREPFNTSATRILIEFAFNLYNYRMPQKSTYCDFVSLDSDNFSLVINALELRRNSSGFLNTEWIKGNHKIIFYSDEDYELLYKNAFAHTVVLDIGERDKHFLLFGGYRGFINKEDFVGIEEQVISYLKTRQKEIQERSGFDCYCEFCDQESFSASFYLDILDEEYKHRKDWVEAIGDRHTVTQEEIRISLCVECENWQIDHDC